MKWIIVGIVAALPIGFGLWAFSPVPSAFQGWADANLVLLGLGLAIVVERGFKAQAMASAKGEQANPVSWPHLIGVFAVVAWAGLGLGLLIAGGIQKPIHSYIAIELGTVLPVFSYALAKAVGWNGKLGKSTRNW